MYLKDLLQWASEELEKRNIETPRLDAEVLLAHAMKVDRLRLYLDLEKVVDEESESYYKGLVAKRLADTPVSYLTGHKEFMSLDFVVDNNVLIPRPETEILVETVRRMGKAGSRILELGTGSGAITVSLAVYNTDWHFVATDLSMKALLVARENARYHGVMDRISFLQGDLLDAFSSRCEFDLVVSNPPYISTRELAHLPPEIRDYEPILALDGGTDGLDVIRRIIAEAHRVLGAGGWLAIEIGYGQDEDVQKIADETGVYSDCHIVRDYSGIPRVLCCKRRSTRLPLV